MSKEFVERRNESFYLIGSRVPLAHLVREFQRGESPEAIRSHYPALSLEQVCGAITFYLGSWQGPARSTNHSETTLAPVSVASEFLKSQEAVEADIAEREREEDGFTAAHPPHPEVRMKFERMRQQN